VVQVNPAGLRLPFRVGYFFKTFDRATQARPFRAEKKDDLRFNLESSARTQAEGKIRHLGPERPGGGFDGSSRIAAMAWEKKLGVPIKFSHLPGGSTTIGVGRMLTTADGYTTSITTISMLYLALEIQKAKFSWKDIAFIGNPATDPNQIIVHKDAPWKTAREFIQEGRKAKTTLKISTSHPTANNSLAASWPGGLFIRSSSSRAAP